MTPPARCGRQVRGGPFRARFHSVNAGLIETMIYFVRLSLRIVSGLCNNGGVTEKRVCPMKQDIREYLAEIGAKGGKKSRRSITPDQQAELQKARAIARSRAATDAADAIRRKKARRHARIAAKIVKRTEGGAA